MLIYTKVGISVIGIHDNNIASRQAKYNWTKQF